MASNIHFLIKGLIIGFSIAAPVGPIGVLCIQRSIVYGRASGLFTGLGAATADGLYGAVAAFGLTVISNFFVEQQFWFRPVGGAFLLYLGVRTFFSKPTERAATGNHKGLSSDYLSTLFLTMTNPMTILSFAAIFAGLGLGETNGDFLSASAMTAGVFVGSALWWLILSGGVSLLRSRFNISSMRIANRISGLVIVAFAIWMFVNILKI
ncbi:LysE family transporter [Candidatus Poribacteria bacterium]|nr:LysE family transporter [Candidatus Poribacteria bacterium]